MNVRILERLYVVLHNIHSVIRLVEAARIVYGLGVKNFVVTRAIGAAAQEGIPEVYKIALKYERNLIFLKDLDDLVEALSPNRIYLFAPPQHAKRPYDPDEIISLLSKGKVAIIFGGAEPGLTKRDLEKGIPVYLDIPGNIGTLGEITLALYKLLQKIRN